MGIKNKVKSNKTKEKLYLSSLFLFGFIISILIGIYMNYQTRNILISVIFAILIFIPVLEIVKQIMQFILGKIIKPKLIPKMDLEEGIEDSQATFVVIPTIINNSKKVREMFKKLEVYYLANKSDNIYFALLGDCSSR